MDFVPYAIGINGKGSADAVDLHGKRSHLRLQICTLPQTMTKESSQVNNGKERSIGCSRLHNNQKLLLPRLSCTPKGGVDCVNNNGPNFLTPRVCLPLILHHLSICLFFSGKFFRNKFSFSKNNSLLILIGVWIVKVISA